MMKYRRAFLVAGIFLLLVISASCQVTTAKSNANAGGKPAAHDVQPSVAPKAATADPDYVIGAQDSLHINVWKEPDVSGAVVVRNDGKISLPLLNDVEAAGKTPAQLATFLTDKLKAYVTDPRVTVTVTAINSKRVFLMGEVGHMGAITMLPNMTVLQALATGGGFTKYAKIKRIYILRNDNGQQVKIPFNYKAVISGQAPEQNIVLQPGDTIVVP